MGTNDTNEHAPISGERTEKNGAAIIYLSSILGLRVFSFEMRMGSVANEYQKGNEYNPLQIKRKPVELIKKSPYNSFNKFSNESKLDSNLH